MKEVLLPKFLLSILILYLTKINIGNCIAQAICNLKIADSERASFKGGSNLIYDDGKINDSWSESNQLTPHVSSRFNDIEYLYANEFHFKNRVDAHHEKLVNYYIIRLLYIESFNFF